MRPRPVVGEATVPDAVRRLLDKFDYPDRESPAQIIPILPTLGGGGGAPTVVVAASDASDLSKSKADLLCTGVNDEVVIQAAGTTGRVLLTEGTFSIDAQLLSGGAGGLHLSGLGAGVTVLDASSTAISWALDITGSDILLADFSLISHPSSSGIMMQTGSFNRIEGVAISGGVTQIDLRTSFSRIIDCDLTNSVQDGINVNANNCLVRGCTVEMDSALIGSFGILVNAGIQVHIIDNHVEGTGDVATMIEHDGTYGTLIGNTVVTNGDTHGIVVNGGDFLVVAGNNITWSNTATSAAAGIYIDGADHLLVAANVITSSYYGIHLPSSTISNRPVITGNIIGTTEAHGIFAEGIADGIVSDNLIYRPGQAANNTWDGIILASNSDRNDIRNNKIIGASASPKPRYGINISAATCDDNSYLGNRTGPGTDYGTGAYNDAGTGTVNTWPGAAAPQGDNLL